MQKDLGGIKEENVIESGNQDEKKPEDIEQISDAEQPSGEQPGSKRRLDDMSIDELRKLEEETDDRISQVNAELEKEQQRQKILAEVQRKLQLLAELEAKLSAIRNGEDKSDQIIPDDEIR